MRTSLILIFVFLFCSHLFSQDEEPPVLHSIAMMSDSALSGDSISIIMEISDDIEGVSGYRKVDFVYTIDKIGNFKIYRNNIAFNIDF